MCFSNGVAIFDDDGDDNDDVDSTICMLLLRFCSGLAMTVDADDAGHFTIRYLPNLLV